MTKKRDNYLSWDNYFMAVAIISAQRSKDPNTQVGACIVSADNKIIGIGYNGFPIGCSDTVFPWAREGEWKDTKYPYVCHAELNAITNSHHVLLKGSSIYCTLFPCNECAKLIIQSGIKRVVYYDNKYVDTKETFAAAKMFISSGIELIQHYCDIELGVKVTQRQLHTHIVDFNWRDVSDPKHMYCKDCGKLAI